VNLNLLKVFTILILFIGTLFSQSKQIKLLPPENGIYHTAFSTMYSSSNNVSTNEVPYFENIAGKKIVWLNFANDWFEGIKFPLESAKNIYKDSVIPSIRLMPWTRYDKHDMTYSLKKIANGDFDGELAQWAKDLQASGIPVLIDFAAEPNGDWFPWSGVFNGAGKTNGYGDKNYPDGPELYRDAYMHIIDIFNEEGTNRVTWVFHVNAIGAPQEQCNKKLLSR
jgi:hypothetical protein